MQRVDTRILVMALCLITVLLSAGCTTSETRDKTITTSNTSSSSPTTDSGNESSWMTFPITDVITGKETSILDLANQGKPVIIHTFAVWCPACSMQLRETAKLLNENPDAFTVLGIDIDPRENTAMVKNHVEKNKFIGVYVAAPTDMTRSLIQTAGTKIVQSLPQTMIICNKKVTYVGDGVFPEAKLKTILTELC